MVMMIISVDDGNKFAKAAADEVPSQFTSLGLMLQAPSCCCCCLRSVNIIPKLMNKLLCASGDKIR